MLRGHRIYISERVSNRMIDDDGGIGSRNAREDGANDSSIGPIDVHVGHRICARRKLLQLSQKQMAEKLGITFQQVQKYEKGVNRIGAGRLYSIAMILGVDIDYFYEEVEPESSSQCMYDLGLSNNYLREDDGDFKIDPMHGAEAIMLLKAFYSLPQRARTALLAMLSSLKDKEDTESDI